MWLHFAPALTVYWGMCSEQVEPVSRGLALQLPTATHKQKPCSLTKSSHQLYAWVTLSQHSTLHHPVGANGRSTAPAQQHCGQSGWSKVGDGLSGERHIGPKPQSHAAAGQKTDWALVVNICSRDCTICPRPVGGWDQLSCLGPAAEHSDVDVSSHAEVEKTAKTVRVTEQWEVHLALYLKGQRAFDKQM